MKLTFPLVCKLLVLAVATGLAAYGKLSGPLAALFGTGVLAFAYAHGAELRAGVQTAARVASQLGDNAHRASVLATLESLAQKLLPMLGGLGTSGPQTGAAQNDNAAGRVAATTTPAPKPIAPLTAAPPREAPGP